MMEGCVRVWIQTSACRGPNLDPCKNSFESIQTILFTLPAMPYFTLAPFYLVQLPYPILPLLAAAYLLQARYCSSPLPFYNSSSNYQSSYSIFPLSCTRTFFLLPISSCCYKCVSCRLCCGSGSFWAEKIRIQNKFSWFGSVSSTGSIFMDAWNVQVKKFFSSK